MLQGFCQGQVLKPFVGATNPTFLKFIFLIEQFAKGR